MINVVDLENRWLKFKIKSYIPYLVIIFSIITITILFFVILDTDKSDDKVPSKLTNETAHVNTIKKQKTEAEAEDTKPVPTKQPEIRKTEEKTTENKIDIAETKYSKNDYFFENLSIYLIDIIDKEETLWLIGLVQFRRR